MFPRFYPLARGIAISAIVLALVTPTALAQNAPPGQDKKAAPAAQEKDNGKPADTGKPADKGKPADSGKPADTGKPADNGKPASNGGPPATSGGNTQGNSGSNPDGGGVSKPYAADGQPAGSQGTGVLDGNNGCGQEKKAGGPRDADGGYDDNNGNCGGKPKPPGKPGPGLHPVTPPGGGGNTPSEPILIQSPTEPVAASSPVVAPIETVIVTIPEVIGPPIQATIPVGGVATVPTTVTLPNGTTVPLPPGVVITVPVGVGVIVLPPAGTVVLPAASGPGELVAGVSVRIPAGSVVTAAGLGSVTLTAPLEVVLGEQVSRLAQLPVSLPRAGGFGGGLGGLLGALGLATFAGGAYLRRKTMSS